MSERDNSKEQLGPDDNPEYDSPDARPSPKRPPFQRFLRHAAGIFKTTKGTYINAEGIEVYGRLPRTKLENPIRTLWRPSWMNYVYFFVGWMAWTMDGYDFFTVSLSLSRLAKEFNQPRDSVSTSITLTLLFRSVGAIVFGLLGDLYGRKWPLIINLILVAVLQLGTAFCNTFQQFLAVRSLFGIGMGGIWGLSSSMALENMPVEARGLFSGILQQGYSLGYLIAAVFNLALVPHSSHSWRLLFYIGAGMTAAVAIARLFFPESKQFLERKANEKEGKLSAKKKVHDFLQDLKEISKQYWKRMLYCIVLMTFFNALSHGSQDLYPTFVEQTKGFSPFDASKATILGTTGAIIGGTILGYISQTIGRRLSIITASILGLALIPLWILPTSWGALAAGAFLMQFMVQGAWGIVPVHLQELSPPHFRSSFPGVAYQVGNMISSAVPQIAASIAENWHVKGGDGKVRPDYARTQGLIVVVVFMVLAGWTFAGTEVLGTHFEHGKAAGDRSEGVKDGGERRDSGAAWMGEEKVEEKPGEWV